jgi:selenide, water dikinase
LPRAGALARAGAVTGASHRNWAAFGEAVDLPADLPEWRRHLLTDPQTSGGLLVTCSADRADAILARVRAAGYPAAARIGRIEPGPARIRVAA